MTDPYIEDDGAEFPFNNCVRCGQTEYQAGFGEDPVQTGKDQVDSTQGAESEISAQGDDTFQEVIRMPQNPAIERGFLFLILRETAYRNCGFVWFLSQTFHTGLRRVKPSVRKQVSSPSPQRAFFCLR